MQPNASDDSRKPAIPGTPHCSRPRITPRACPALVHPAPHPTAGPATAPVARLALPLAPPTGQAPHPTRPACPPPVTATVVTQEMRRTEEQVRLIRTLDSPLQASRATGCRARPIPATLAPPTRLRTTPLRLTSKTEPPAQPNPVPHRRHPVAPVTPATPRTVVQMPRTRLFRPRIRDTARTVYPVPLNLRQRLTRPPLAMPAVTRLPRRLPPARLTVLTTMRL